jgi:tetratricopeptide (TPR) repeat protein/pSer/pThr/pTyr-binding forkhead associated (FHA) protein
MPDTTYLHIQGRESDPTRVIALPGAAVRVGRGPHCEIALAEPEIAEVQFLLRRRGNTWQVQPVGQSPLLRIDGVQVDHLQTLPFGVPLQVGAHRLVIRPAEWGSYQAPFEVGPRFGTNRSVDPRPATASREPEPRINAAPLVASSSGSDAEVERLKRWQLRLEQRERWLQTRQDEKKWETRWKAAGEGLRARSGASPRPEVVRPSQPETPRTSRIVSPPVARANTSTPASGRVVSPTEPRRPASKPVPAPVDPVPRPSEPTRLALPAPVVVSELPPPVEVPTEPTSLVEIRSLVEMPTAPVEPPVEAVDVQVDDSTDDVLPIERSILLEAERTNPIWDNPTGFVADARSTSASFWHEHAYAVEPESESTPPESRGESLAPPQTSTPESRAEFPSAAAIFAAQGTRPTAEVRPKRRAKHRPVPTDPRAPAQWVMPAWIATPPVALVALGMVGVGVVLGLAWMKDSSDADLALKAVMRSEKEPPVPIDPAIRPESRWWKSTAGHMAHWAAAIDRSSESRDRADEVTELLHSASRAAPLQVEVRLAQAVRDNPDPAQSLAGLSRDVVSLTSAGRSFKRAGKNNAAIHAYRLAIELATQADPIRLDPPSFDDDPQLRRFRLPHESLVGSVVRDMNAAGTWTLDDWTRALPESALARYAAARSLREAGNADASAVFDLALAEIPVPEDRAQAAEHLAAKAEAYAFKGRQAEAADWYAKAIDGAAEGPVKRRWQLGLAELLATLGRPKERAALLEAAKGADPTEDVTRKAIEAQKVAGLQ